MRQNLQARHSVSLLAAPVSWGKLSVIEMALAVSPDGYIVMADEAGEISFGQQIEGFAIALKRGTGARYADFEGVDAESGEPINDEALEQPTGGRSVLLGSFSESDVASFAGVTKTAWHYFRTEHADVAIHEGYMPEIMLSKSLFPAIMLSRMGPRFSMVFWFKGQSKKLHGYPGFGHGWSVAAHPVLDPPVGTESAEVAAFLAREWLAPDLESISQLAQYGIPESTITQLNDALSGSGSIEKLSTVLEIFGRPGSLADYAEKDELPQAARLVAPRGIGATVATSMGAEARGNGTATNSTRAETQAMTRFRKFFNPLRWRPRSQLIWGVLQALVAIALVALTDWDEPRFPLWASIVVTALWALDAVSNIGIGIWRSSRKNGK
ncbi:hypothetical protein [Paeniglutamicibacter terrestris]|uniref:Uncharacterized protein n=1 Tax=Paeniglutamicibacter terrestris TaxID=2723403 RepID=A0ABX1G7S1_9MICC|nr:hypothetical protein [Paeniglutamicibacter terrestris]NKG22302.1 hypothetical protein [Paeniglutamicibacter terrestris]